MEHTEAVIISLLVAVAFLSALATRIGVPYPILLVRDLPWAVAFALGAIVAPTDPVAATQILRRFDVPRRTVNIIEGEALINDASALVLYRIAVVAIGGGAFSLMDAGPRFVAGAAGGVAIGLVIAVVIRE